MCPRVAIFSVFLASTLAAPAAAQGLTPQWTIGIGVGRADPIPIYLPFKTPTWSVSVERSLAKHLVMEAVIGSWRHERFGSVPEWDGTSEPLTWTDRSRLFGVRLNVLAVATVGRIRFASGTGAGVARFFHRFVQTVPGCPTGTPECGTLDETENSTLFSAQCLLGADVRLTPRVSAFVAYRLSQPFTAELGDFSALTGLKIGFGRR